MTPGDYAQDGDPYKIGEEYTAQSATTEMVGSDRCSDHDARGNSLTKPRGIPTQEEANEIMREAKR